LGDSFLEHHRTKTTFLDASNERIDWRPLYALLCKRLRGKASAVGNPASPPLAMFKILLLQREYSASKIRHSGQDGWNWPPLNPR